MTRLRGTVLVVDDEKNIRRTLGMVLGGVGLEVLEAGSAEEAYPLIGQNEIDLIALDVRLPGASGIDALKHIRRMESARDVPILMISGHASVAEAVRAVQEGANDFFEKPLDRARLLHRIERLLEARALRQEVESLRARFWAPRSMLGETEVMQALYAQIEKVAPTVGRVLVTGESGTGKELVARAIHEKSPRAESPFVKVNCAAIPNELIESELFGHERGAFTGASQRRRGLFEQAHEGTLFLDEVGDMSLHAQAKVLRALQSGEIQRVGSEKTIAVDVRVVAATNKDLEEAVADGTFREDLYFRLAVVPLQVAPLRERRADVAILARHFLEEFCRTNELRAKALDEDALELLQRRSWPGNVRELKNTVERMAILGGEVLGAEDVPPDPRATPDEEHALPESWLPELGDERPTLKTYRELAERSYILRTLAETEWNISHASRLLGVERTNLHKRMRALGIRRSDRDD